MNKNLLYCLSILLLFSLFMISCNYREQYEQSDSDLSSKAAYEKYEKSPVAYGHTIPNIKHHENEYLDFQKTTSNEVMKIKGVGQAYVFVTNKNAYVTIMTRNNATGIKNSETIDQNKGGDINAHPSQIMQNYRSAPILPRPENISHILKQKIALCVRSYHTPLQEVFITANPDMMNLFDDFAKKTYGGEPLQPYVSSFNEAVKNHFGE
ncbi:hypothetical protein [Longirhabdus pacifica]|uniref:hypothetical protein n=1 Tax=Longirhabdus pacifica TaxID=2305227 RepID=UPI001008C190|nr:hypothetical protein [Longirhabdus pacifica]